MDADPTPGIGHNNPPEPTPLEKLIAEANERIDTANRWITERPEITDAEMADKAGGFKKQLSGTFDAIDGIRLEENRAFKAAQEAKYKSILDLLTKAKDAVNDKITAWLKRERERLLAEQRAREAEARRQREEAEAAQRAADEAARKAGADALRALQAAEEKRRVADLAEKIASTPVRAAVKGDYTSRAMTIRQNWKARVTDQKAALKHYGKHPVVQKAALDAALQLAEAEAKARKGQMPPPGFEFYPEEKAA